MEGLGDVEQYIHTLIPESAEYSPKSSQVVNCIDCLMGSFNFRLVDAPHLMSSLRVLRPGDQVRSYTDPLTGERKSFAVPDVIAVGEAKDIPALIDPHRHWTVRACGEWSGDGSGVRLLDPEGAPFKQPYWCDVSFHLRPEPVSMSFWSGELPPPGKAHVPFGSPCEEAQAASFSNPWSGALIQVPGAGRARFWVEFEFGKFLLPAESNSLDLLAPDLVRAVADGFQVGFLQGWRGE